MLAAQLGSVLSHPSGTGFEAVGGSWIFAQQDEQISGKHERGSIGRRGGMGTQARKGLKGT